MGSFTCFFIILLGLGVADAAFRGNAAPPEWEIVYGNRRAAADLQVTTDNTFRQQATNHANPLEMSSLMRRLAEALLHTGNENSSPIDSITWRDSADDDDTNDSEFISNMPPLSSNLHGGGQRSLIPKRAHGKCGIFKICSPMRLKSN